MATATHIPVETYLHTSYEPDAEYVDGQIQERSMGELDHAAWQAAILDFFRSRRHEWNIRVFAELRVRVSSARFRVPDVVVLRRSVPLSAMEQIITEPPIAVIEILSPEDTLSRMMEKLADYEQMKVGTILVFDPKGPKYRYGHGSLTQVEQVEMAMPAGSCTVDLRDIEKLLD